MQLVRLDFAPVNDRKSSRFLSARHGGSAQPSRVLKRMHRPHRDVAVEGIVILVSPVKNRRFDKAAG